MTSIFIQMYTLKTLSQDSEKRGKTMNSTALGFKNDYSSDRANEEKKRMSLTLSVDAVEKLEWLAKVQGGISLNEAIRRAIATEGYIRKEIEADSKLLVQKSNGDIRELVFR